MAKEVPIPTGVFWSGAGEGTNLVMGWSCSTQSGFPLEKHFYQANIIWSGIYFIKHIYNTLDKFKTMYENRNKIHKR